MAEKVAPSASLSRPWLLSEWGMAAAIHRDSDPGRGIPGSKPPSARAFLLHRPEPSQPGLAPRRALESSNAPAPACSQAAGTHAETLSTWPRRVTSRALSGMCTHHRAGRAPLRGPAATSLSRTIYASRAPSSSREPGRRACVAAGHRPAVAGEHTGPESPLGLNQARGSLSGKAASAKPTPLLPLLSFGWRRASGLARWHVQARRWQKQRASRLCLTSPGCAASCSGNNVELAVNT